MKPVCPAVVFLAFVLPAVAQSTPAPRARLQPPPAADNASPSAVAPATPAVPLDRYIVRVGKLPPEPAQPAQPTGPFTLLGGGRVFERGQKGRSMEIGLWPWEDIMKDGAKFQPSRTRVDMDAVRVRW